MRPPVLRDYDSDPSRFSAATQSGDVLGDGSALPFPDGRFDAVAALYCLYHFPEPAHVVAEARRVLRTGGWFVACAPSRRDAPELVRRHDPSPFDAEDAEAIVANAFGSATSDWWDGPYVHLADDTAVGEYVRGHLLRPEQLCSDVRAPLTLTKRGVVVWAQKAKAS